MPITTTRALAAVAALCLVTSACGGGQDTTSPADYPEFTEFVDGEAMPTDSPEEPTSSSSSSTAPPTTTEASSETTVTMELIDAGAQVASTPEFCAASADYFVGTQAGDFISLQNSAAIEVLFNEMDERVALAIAAAPNDELAAPAIAAQGHLSAIHNGIASVGYDGHAFEASQTFIDLGPDFDALAVINGQLESYLEGECGLSIQQLRADGLALGESIIAETGGPASVTYYEVVDPSERIRVSVPSHWTDVSSEPIGETAELVATTNVALFETTWAIDGIRIITAPTAESIDVRTALDQSSAANECSLISSEPYDDGTYVGWIEHYRGCGGSSVATVIGATSYDNEFTVLVELQFDDEDTQTDAATLQTVIDTFLVR